MTRSDFILMVVGLLLGWAVTTTLSGVLLMFAINTAEPFIDGLRPFTFGASLALAFVLTLPHSARSLTKAANERIKDIVGKNNDT